MKNPEMKNLSMSNINEELTPLDSPHWVKCLICGKHHTRAELVSNGYICTRYGAAGRTNFTTTEESEIVLPLTA